MIRLALVVAMGLMPARAALAQPGAPAALPAVAQTHDAAGGEAAQVARDFGKRSDVTPDAFAYAVESGLDGPRYRPCWPD